MPRESGGCCCGCSKQVSNYRDIDEREYVRLGHSPGRIVLIVLTFVIMVVTVFINALSSNRSNLSINLFTETTNIIAQFYSIEFLPPSWSFFIWFAIYIWQFAWCIYTLINICRRSSLGGLYLTPNFIPKAMYIFVIVNLLANTAWVLIFDRCIKLPYLLPVSVAVILIVFITLLVAFFSATQALGFEKQIVMSRVMLKKDVWLTRILLHNGLGLYLGWLAVAWVLNFAVCLAYFRVTKTDSGSIGWELGPNGPMNSQNSTTMAYAIVLFEVVVYTIVDIVALDSTQRWVISPYLVPVWAMIGLIVKPNYPNIQSVISTTNGILNLSILCISVFALLLKIVVSIIRALCCRNNRISEARINDNSNQFSMAAF